MSDDPETTEENVDATTPADAPESEAPAASETSGAAAEPEAPAEPEVVLTPKERKQARRARAVAKRGPRRARTQEERDAERKRKADSRRRYRARLKEKKADEPKHEAPEPAPRPEGQPKVRTGIVVSNKADKTITVRIDVARRHRRYKKTIRSSTTLHAHDESNDANEGDTVRVIESRPLSRTKRWRLVEILERAR
jgi:small subunit ribosomal protein S17